VRNPGCGISSQPHAAIAPGLSDLYSERFRLNCAPITPGDRVELRRCGAPGDPYTAVIEPRAMLVEI
jgi:hypothetical protein